MVHQSADSWFHQWKWRWPFSPVYPICVSFILTCWGQDAGIPDTICSTYSVSYIISSDLSKPCDDCHQWLILVGGSGTMQTKCKASRASVGITHISPQGGIWWHMLQQQHDYKQSFHCLSNSSEFYLFIFLFLSVSFLSFGDMFWPVASVSDKYSTCIFNQVCVCGEIILVERVQGQSVHPQSLALGQYF